MLTRYALRKYAAALRTDPFRKLRRHRHRREDELRAEYQALPVSKQPDTFGLYRIIGNDLPPRHRTGKSETNFRFILENEPPLERCEKRWIVNRIYEPQRLEAVVAQPERFGQRYGMIPFELDEYCKLEADTGCLPHRDYLDSWEYRRLDERARLRLDLALLRPRILYAMNINAARNLALNDGKRTFKWVLPWDGATFVTANAWDDIRSTVEERPHFRYFLVPLTRIEDNRELLKPDFYRTPQDEPQIVFRRDSRETFDPELPYGNRNKIELLARLRVPGPWLKLTDGPWDLPRRRMSPEEGQFACVGWVARLASCVSIPSAGRPHRQDMLKIYDLRLQGIRAMIKQLDRDATSLRPVAHPLLG